MAKNHSRQSSEVILAATEANSASSPTDAVGPPDAFAHSAIVTPVQALIASPIVEPSAPLSPPELPPYPLLSQPAFTWGQLDGQDFTQAISAAYVEVVHWRRNQFLVPSGKVGRDFVTELARLFQSYAEGSALESVALKAAMVMPHLLLQKPSASSKAKDHSSALSRRLIAWEAGDLDGLLREGRVIQRHFRHATPHSNEESLASSFSKLMLAGKTRTALRLLTKEGRGNVLPLDQLQDPCNPSAGTVLDALKEKHPPPQTVDQQALSTNTDQTPECHPVIFDNITGATIRNAALRGSGSAGPSGMDAAAWRRICTAFKTASSDICHALALLARRICAHQVDPDGLSAYTACRLIALDKCPGVRPIGVAEVVRRLLGKAILSVAGTDVQHAAGAIQLCAGQEVGCEAAIHSIRTIFTDSGNEGVLLVDASNAFNLLNRQVALRNITTICPSIATVLINTYRGDAELFVDSETLYSREGTTQGDPLAMAFYALATVPLIKACQINELAGEVWFADDATGGGSLTALRSWWDKLVTLGPNFGYHPNGDKTWLVVKEGLEDAATEAFVGTSVRVTTQGRKHLGAALGSRSFVEQCVSQQVEEWIAELEQLSTIARSHPQAAYSAYSHGLKGKWLYLARTVPNIGNLLQPLENILREKFIPALTGRPAPGDTERELLALPARNGGLGIINPATIAEREHQASLHLSAPLISLIIQRQTDLAQSTTSQRRARREIMQAKREYEDQAAANVHDKLPKPLQRARKLASEKGASSWLTALPLQHHGFAIHKGAFRDALALRYGWALERLPSQCICGKPFNTDHALNCPTGGFPTVRHNEVRDLLASLLTEVCSDVAVEPALQPITGETFQRRSTSTDNGARLDIRVRGFWGSRSESAFFDVRIFNPNAPSNHTPSCAANYRRHEKAKRNLYEERIREVEHATFTPLVLTTSGGASPLTSTFLKHLASRLAKKRDMAYSTTIGWLRARLNFSLLRSAVMCIRGSRSSVGHALHDSAPDVAVVESRLQTHGTM